MSWPLDRLLTRILGIFSSLLLVVLLILSCMATLDSPALKYGSSKVVLGDVSSARAY
jgi:hypothetical protein